MAKTPEGKVKDKIKKWMREKFPRAWGYDPVQTGYGSHGIPDHIFCVPVRVTQDMVGKEFGMFVSIEAKTPNGRLSEYQVIVGEEITRATGVYRVVYGTDQVELILSTIEQQLGTPPR